MIRPIRWIVLAALVAACGTTTPTTAPGASAPVASAPGSAPAASGAQIQLQPAPDNLGCDTIGVDYQQVTFHIDPAAAEQVTAQADTGAVLHTFWAVGFVGGSAAEKVVRDPAGAVVAADGEVLAIPQGASPRLHSYFVCLSPDAIYVLLADPQ